MLLDEKTYLFNPFNLQKVTDEAICEQINEIATRYREAADNPYDVAFNIEVGANLLYLYGEMIARLTNRYDSTKLENDKGEALETHKLRKEWSQSTTEKAPAIDYFKALAIDKYQISREKEFSVNEMLTRFKYAYKSLESKTNAWKKKLEAFKYDIAGRM